MSRQIYKTVTLTGVYGRNNQKYKSRLPVARETAFAIHFEVEQEALSIPLETLNYHYYFRLQWNQLPLLL